MRSATGEVRKPFGRRNNAGNTSPTTVANRGPVTAALLVAVAAVIGWLLRPGATRTSGDGVGLDGSGADSSDVGGDGD